MSKNQLIILLCTIFSINISHAQSYNFKRIDNENGLSNNQIEAIFKDSKNFMWFATNSGLNRYDGNNFKVYRSDKNDSQTVLSDKIIEILEDINGNLWLNNRTSNYEIYNIHTDKFIHNTDSVLFSYDLPPNPELIKIYEKKELFVYYNNNEVHYLNLETKKHDIYTLGTSSNNLSLGYIAKIEVSQEYIWILFTDGLLERINRETSLVDYRNTYFKEQANFSTIIKNIILDSEGDIWIYPGVKDSGVAYLNANNNTWTLIDKEKTNLLSNDFVRCIIEDNEGKFWIGTDHGGINIYDKHSKKNTILTNDLYDSNSLSQNSITTLFCDNHGVIWVGTYKNGISYYHPDIFKFKKNKLYYSFQKEAKVFDCNSLYKDKKQNLWIGTNGYGLIKYNEANEETESYTHNKENNLSISSNIITSITEDHNGILWVGTFLGGVNAFDGNRFRHFQQDGNNNNSLSSKSVYGINEDNNFNLWIATLGGGINKLDKNRLLFTRFNSTINDSINHAPDYILSTFKDKNGEIYFCTDDGIYKTSINSNVKPLFNEDSAKEKLSSLKCNYLIVDKRGLIWIATDNGLNIFNPNDNTFKYINNKDGLINDEIVSIIEDNSGNIWAGTRNGLLYVECSYQGNNLEYRLTTFDVKDGLPSAVCNQNAIFKDEYGTIYIGTTRGYVSFTPHLFRFNTEQPKIQFTTLIVGNNVIEPLRSYNDNIILQKSITETKKITLKYNDSNIKLKFSAMNYIHPEKNKYKYKLEGLDKDFILCKNGNGEASYSNINPGDYKLIVFASNENGIWSEHPVELSITITPPFWLSNWAYLFYFLILVIIIWMYSRYRLNKQNLKFNQKQKLLEARKTHEVDELKFKFFTNISHEFKTPITLILAPIDQLLKKDTNLESKNLLEIAKKNAQSLLNMVNEILEFRKLDLHKSDLNLMSNDIVAFIKEICKSFTTLAAEKNIRFTFDTFLDHLTFSFDSDKMNKMITNLISNAFKYTEEGEINVNIGISEDLKTNTRKLLIKVSDTGIGIDKKYYKKIFDRFYRIENKMNQPGAGVGLHLVSEYAKMHHGEIELESTPNIGSTFTLLLPIIESTESTQKDDLKTILYTDTDDKILERERAFSPINKGNLPILLVIDDNEDLRNLISSLFSDSYHVVTAEDGSEAMNIVIDQIPDIILCDVMMPKMDGYEFCKKIRSDVRTSHIPIILLSAKSSDENKYLGLKAGADDYIAKPFNTDLLKIKMSKIIEKQQKMQQHFKNKIDISVSEIEITSMDEKFVKKAVEVVEMNIGRPEFLVEDLCKEMSMSRVYFYKKIVALTGKTPSEFIRLIRLKRASDLLKKSQLFVNEIAFQVGFNDPKYFRKYFKEEFGITPNEYKKLHEKL